MLEFLIHRIVDLEDNVRRIETEALHQEAKRRTMTTNEVIWDRIRDKRESAHYEFGKQRLLENLDECGLSRLMEYYAEPEELEKFYHKKAIRERANERRIKRQADKAAKGAIAAKGRKK